MSGNAQITDGQKLTIGGIFITRLDDILRGMSHEAAQGYVGKADKLVEDVRRGIFPVTAIDFSLWLSKWEKFYKKIFGRKYDFAGISIPQAEDVFAWPVCMAGDIPAEDWLNAGKDPLPFWKYTSKKLDDVLDLSFGRDGWTKQYIVRFKANEEADEDLKNISAIKIAEMGINTGALKERLALGRFLYWDKEIILDRKTITLCSGSRCSVGSVPCVDWRENLGKVFVHWYEPGYADVLLRSLRAVS
jgi:hypothetical protein